MPTRTFTLSTLDPIATVQDLLARVDQLRSESGGRTTWYRGQSDAEEHKLIPKIARPHKFNGKKIEWFNADQEYELLHRFTRRAYPHAERIMSPWEALLLGRHYGLPTRLLDWTRNPLTALFFSCVEDMGKDGDVWAIVRAESVKNEIDALGDKHPLKLYPSEDRSLLPGETKDAIRIVYPFYNSPRILAQDGAFTYHSRPSEPLDKYALLKFDEDRLDISHLFRIRVKQSAKTDIICTLDSLGVNRRFVYPDLEGIALSLVEAEVLYRGK
jgi:hypothetical protein